MSQIQLDPDSVPIATWGVNADYAKRVRELIAPTYDVVHACTDASLALKELPALFSGDASTRPSSGIGSNAALSDGEDSRLPKVMAYGGGITPELKQQLITAMKEKAAGAPWADEVKFVEVDRQKMLQRLNGESPRPEVSAELIIEALKDAGLG